MRIFYLFLMLVLALPSYAGRTPIENAIIEGKEGFFELLLSCKDAHPDRSQHAVLNSLVHLAAAFNRSEMILMLHRAGYSLNTINERGMTPLDVAYVMGHWRIARLLQDLGGTFGRRVERALRPPNADIPPEGIQTPPPAIVIRANPAQRTTDLRNERDAVDSYSRGYYGRW